MIEVDGERQCIVDLVALQTIIPGLKQREQPKKGGNVNPDVSQGVSQVCE